MPPPPADSRELPALHRIASVALDGLPPRSALEKILADLLATFAADAGSIALLNPSTGQLETEVQSGAPEGEFALTPGHGITGWCAQNSRAVLVPDVASDPRYIAVRAATRCELAAPLLDDDRVIGVVDLESDRTGGFTAPDLALFVRLAAEISRVTRTLWQLDHLSAKARQLETLVSAGQSLVARLEQKDVLEALARDTRAMLSARACAIYLHDAPTRTLRFAALASAAPSPLPPAPLPLDDCLVSGAVHTRRAVAFADIHAPGFLELPDVPRDPALRSVLATPLRIEGDVLGVLAVFTDRVHRFDNDEKRLCAALASLGAVALQNARLYARVFQSEDSLRRNERLTTLGLLAAEIAHEIRNPLTVLKLLHGGLGLDFPVGDPRRTDMRVIGEKLDQLEAIVTRVLGFAKNPTAVHSRWTLADIVEDTLVLVRLKLAQSRVQLRVLAPPAPLLIEGQKGQLQQVLLNLILNAMQAMPDGGALTLALAPDAAGLAATLDVIDTGGGIPPEIRDRIFDSFLSGRPGGTGLGLAIARRIAEAHRGELALLASGPAGTTMRVTLPLAHA